MSNIPVAGELWMRPSPLRKLGEEYYFINSIAPHPIHFDNLQIVHFTVFRDGQKTFDASADMVNFIKSTIRAR